MDSKVKIYKYQPKIIRFLGYFTLILIPLMILILIYNFNIYAMFGIITMSIFVVLLCYWCNNSRIEIYDDKIISYVFKKRVFELKKIKSLSVNDHGYILLDYNVKVYRICGFIDFLTQSCNIEKNKALVTEINSKIKKLKKWK